MICSLYPQTLTNHQPSNLKLQPSNLTLHTQPSTLNPQPSTFYPQPRDTLALLPLVKRQVFCVGDRLKMDKHKAWATTIVAPKSVGSSTTKGQMKPTFRVSLTASQAGENSQINAPEHTNVSSILAYLTFRRNQGRRTAPSGPTIESAKQQTSSNEFQNSNSTQYHHKLPT